MSVCDHGIPMVHFCGDCYRPPEVRALVDELRRALGMFAGAMSKSPQEAWQEAIEEVRRLAGTHE